MGYNFHPGLLMKVAGIGEETLSKVLELALRLGLIEPSLNKYAFVHSVIREALIKRISDSDWKDRNQRIGEVLKQLLDTNSLDKDWTEGRTETELTIARFLSKGDHQKNPHLTFEATLKGGLLAIDNFMFSEAYGCLKVSEVIAETMDKEKRPLQVHLKQIHKSLGIVCTRLGQCSEAHRYLDLAFKDIKTKCWTARRSRRKFLDKEIGQIYGFHARAFLTEMQPEDTIEAGVTSLRYLGFYIPNSKPFLVLFALFNIFRGYVTFVFWRRAIKNDREKEGLETISDTLLSINMASSIAGKEMMW